MAILKQIFIIFEPPHEISRGQKYSNVDIPYYDTAMTNSIMLTALNAMPALCRAANKMCVVEKHVECLDQEIWVEMMRMRFTGAAACCPHGCFWLHEA